MEILRNAITKVAAIHDLSGLGHCSLSVIFPILSIMGIQVCAVPTAILSTHTGGFGNIEMRDLTDYIPSALQHYKNLNESFDCVYSGFLASKGQIDHCLEFFDEYKSSLKVVDPVMGDNGKPYKTCTPELRLRMRELVSIADIITPNLTETGFLLGEDYSGQPLIASQVKSMLVKLSKMGPKEIIITSIPLCDGTMCNVGYDCENNTFWKVPYIPIAYNYPGTGDMFTSVLVGSLMQGDSLPIAMNRATNFMELAIKTTYSYNIDRREGVMLERCLEWLVKNPNLYDYQTL